MVFVYNGSHGNIWCHLQKRVSTYADGEEVRYPEDIDSMREETLPLDERIVNITTGLLTVLPTNSWNAALAARRMWTSRS
jgi:hypothetical protein